MASDQILPPPPQSHEGLSQVEHCYWLLRGWIVSCTLQPDQRLTERDLINRTGFGRTPVREALLRLDHDGLVTTLPRSGYRVTPLNEQTINHLYDVWRLLGPLTARLAFYKMTPAIRHKIAGLDFSNLAKESAVEQSRRFGSLFEILAAATENDQLIYIYHRLAADMERMFVLFLATGYGDGWLPEQAALYDLSRSTDPDGVAAMVAEAIAASHQGIISAYRSQPRPLAALKRSGKRQ